MLVDDIFNTNDIDQRTHYVLEKECSQFISDSDGYPLYKLLPTAYPDFHKVKVRFKRTEDQVRNVFNQAFLDETFNISQRAIFANSSMPAALYEQEPFFVFPINNYRFLYSKEVSNSSNDYKHIMDIMLEAFDDRNKATNIVTDLLKYTYSSSQLVEGLRSNAEIIIYGVPYYYAVRVSSISNYSTLINNR